MQHCLPYYVTSQQGVAMKKLLSIGVIAAAALTIGIMPVVHAQQVYAPPALDATGFANSEPNTAPGYNPTPAPVLPEAGPNSASGGGTNGNAWEITGNGGATNGAHNNGRTTFEAQYSEQNGPYRFTGEAPLGHTTQTQDRALQAFQVNGAGTQLQAPLTYGQGHNVAGPYSFGFTGNGGDLYHGPYQSGMSSSPLYPTGTGSVDVNGYYSGSFNPYYGN